MVREDCAGQADAEQLLREFQQARARRTAQRDLVLSVGHARVQITAWMEGYNHERPHSALGYETPVAFVAELHKQWPAPLYPAGSAAQAIAYPGTHAQQNGPVLIPDGEKWGARQYVRIEQVLHEIDGVNGAQVICKVLIG